jgi:hypothetical protein
LGAALIVAGVWAFAACGSDSTPTPSGSTDAGADTATSQDSSQPQDSATSDAAEASTSCGSVSCYVAADGTCDEYPSPSPTQCADVPTACSNRGGTVAKPAACPTAGFVGKCTITPSLGGSTYVTRFYKDAAGSESFCKSIAMGTWSTTF